MDVRLGVNTRFAAKRWPRPEDWAPIVRDQLEIGLVQHCLDLVEPPLGSGSIVAPASAVRKAATLADLELHSTISGQAINSANLLLHPDPDARSAARIFYHRAIAFSARIGAGATGGHVGAFSMRDWTDPERKRRRWSEMRAALVNLAQDARRAGLEAFLVENRAAAREPSTMAMIRELIDEGGPDRAPIRPALDLGHMCVAGTAGDEREPSAWLRAFASRAPVVQLQQSDAERDRHWPFTPQYNALGRIKADWVIDALGEGGAQHVVFILEVIPPFEEDDQAVLDDLRASVDYWREALARRGLGESATSAAPAMNTAPASS
jgi:sugar phosphate isomerase/epimerase